MMSLKSYRDLVVWQKGDGFVECYRITNLLPKNETYRLISQIQRAEVSIPANIAEGHGRDHLGDYLHHLSVANGSRMELETHLWLLPLLVLSEIQRIGERTKSERRNRKDIFRFE